MKHKTIPWLSLLSLWMVLFLDTLGIGIVLPSLNYLLLDQKATLLPHNGVLGQHFAYTMMISIPIFMALFGALFLGELSDRIGRRKALILAMFGSAISNIVSVGGVFTGTFSLILLGRFLFGLMDGSEAIAQAAVADICPPNRKVVYMGIVTLASSIGFVFGPIIGGWLGMLSVGYHMGYSLPFIFTALMSLVNILLLSLFFKETFQSKVGNSLHVIRDLISNIREQGLNLFTALDNKNVRWLSALFFCIQFVWGSYFETINLVVVEKLHFNTQQVGWFMSGIGGMFTFTIIILVPLLTRFLRPIHLIMLAMPCLLISSILPLVLPTLSGAWWSMVPITLGVGLSYNATLASMSDAVSKERQGNVMGLSIAIISIAWLTAGVVSALLTSWNINSVYWVSLIFPVIGLGLAGRVDIKKA